MVVSGKQIKGRWVGVVWISGGPLVPVLGRDTYFQWLVVALHGEICYPGEFWSI